MNEIIHEIEMQQMDKKIPDFAAGDTVAVHVKVVEGETPQIETDIADDLNAIDSLLRDQAITFIEICGSGIREIISNVSGSIIT